jgi:Methyltransferase domain
MNRDRENQLISTIASVIETQEFMRLTLGKYNGSEVGLRKAIVRLIQVKAGIKLSIKYCYQTKEIVKNYSIEEGLELIQNAIGQDFMTGRLFTTQNDWVFDYDKQKNLQCSVTKPTLSESMGSTTPQAHDQKKTRLIPAQGNAYLMALGVVSEQGTIVKSMEDKFRQINKFIEIVKGLVESSSLVHKDQISVVDMGSGKGYLTFAMYDFLNNTLGKPATVMGIEYRSELVEFCNAVARSIEFEQLTFQPGQINSYTVQNVDITIALHACDTATDDAIYQGIQSGSSLIILSPCCHKQIRKEMNPQGSLKDLLRFGILLERQAEIITDGLRSLFLELSGYDTKVFEFISPEHTSKNTMVVGIKHTRSIQETEILAKINDIKHLYGIQIHYLETLLYPDRILSPNWVDRLRDT